VTRFEWMQFRAQALVALGFLAVIVVVLAITGPQLSHLYDTTVANCAAQGDCTAATAALLSKDRLLRGLGNVVLALPALAGIFWGAPLVARELEARTEYLAWAQGVTRSRWIVVKLTLIGLTCVATSGLLSLVITWWSRPFDRVNMDQFTSVFDQRDIVPIGYAVFAFALGAAAGAVIHRTLPAMATTLVAFASFRVAFTQWVRPHLISPLRVVSPIHVTAGMTYESTNNGPITLLGAKPGAWVYSSQVVNQAGHPVFNGFLDRGACLQSRGAPACIGKLLELLVYQPASRYWIFQWYEMAVFLGLGLALGGFCAWWVRHRLP
jgi:hypothetical protein